MALYVDGGGHHRAIFGSSVSVRMSVSTWLAFFLVLVVGNEENVCSSLPDESLAILLRASKDVWHRSQYYGTFGLGTPAKQFNLMIDTGSFDISVQV